MTGYFGISPCQKRGNIIPYTERTMLSRPFPDVPSRWTKVHVVKDGTAICGSNIGNDMGFRNITPGICLKWVECKKCQKLAQKLVVNTPGFLEAVSCSCEIFS